MFPPLEKGSQEGIFHTFSRFFLKGFHCMCICTVARLPKQGQIQSVSVIQHHILSGMFPSLLMLMSIFCRFHIEQSRFGTLYSLGKPGATKMIKFSEILQTAFENMLRFWEESDDGVYIWKIIKHRHRRNVTSHCSFSFLWLFQLLLILSQNKFFLLSSENIRKPIFVACGSMTRWP